MEHVFTSYWDYQNFRIIECQNCGFKHIEPIPSQEFLKEFYREKYYRDVKPFPYRNITEDYIRTIKENIGKSPYYQELYRKIMNSKQTKALGMIDIGCGYDLMSLIFQNNGWNVYIIEPGVDAGAYLQKFGLKVFNYSVEEISCLDLRNISFVNMQYVLEHLPNPYQVLKEIHQILEPGGVIRILVPNDFSEGQLAYQEYFHEQIHWACLPDHINYFTFDSLKKLLNRTGFKEIYRTTNFPLEFLLMAGINYYDREEDKAKVGPFVTNFESSLKNTGREQTLKALYENLAQLGFGRSIIMYAIKEVN